ncbi:MAG: DUF1501 domain-containing protein [Planctomycetia bacterium]|nr:DUF1501 domain-containing protein [Planctomycetia bacterium]
MLNILGSRRKACDGLIRREFLQAGGISLFGLGLGSALQAAPSADDDRLPHFGRAKSCILLYLYGSPSQLETFDVKPEAPLEIRGTLGHIPTVIPGYHIGELLPETAKVLDRTTVVRSMTHPYPVHGIAYATTGLPVPEGNMEVTPKDPRHWPFIGSVVEHLDERRFAEAPALPRNIALPFPLSTRRANQPFRAGPYAAFLGSAYDPIWTEFQGEGTKVFTQENRGVVQEFRDPYGGIGPDGRFDFTATSLLPDLTIDRLSRRRSLQQQLEEGRRQLDATARLAGYDRAGQTAYSLLTSRRLSDALDVQKEPMSVRDTYGMTLWGQASLVARRLIEAGGRFVSIFWDEYGLADSAWDTHYQHYPRMKDELCPTFDQAYPALIRDLEARGLLDETLVVCISEHGRTPQINKAKGGGRDHWSQAYSAIFAGGGFAKGNVVGKTDRFAGEVAGTPVSPKDILATVYHLLGISPETIIHDPLNRPYPVAGAGQVRAELIA